MDFFYTPSAIELYLSETSAAADALNADMISARGAGRISTTAFNGWNKEYSGWKAFRATASTWTGSSVDAAERFRETIRAWRKTLDGAGVKVTQVPMPSAPNPSPVKAVTEAVSSTGLAIATPLVVVGALVAGWFIFGKGRGR